jgi:outer membrane protein assembly factor BamB
MVYAFAEDCATDGSVCDPLWSKPTEPTRATNGFVVNDVPWRLAVYDGIVFAIAKGDHDGLYAFDATSGRPLWKHTEAFTGSLSPFNTPVLESGFVLANLGEEGLQAFPIRCRTDAGQCGASWTSSPGSFISSGGGIVYTNGWTSGTAGTAYALPANCGTGGATCKPLWTAPDDGWGETAAGEGKLFVTSIAGDALDAFPAGCSDPCEADWTAHGIGGPRWAPVVENGLVYVGSADGSLHAFSVSCGTGGQTCEPIWSRRVPDSVMSPPAIAGTRLFAVTLDGRLVSFEIPTSNQTRSPSSAPFWLGLVSLGALVMLLVVRAVRSRSI